jgi:hypothetical protein
MPTLSAPPAPASFPRWDRRADLMAPRRKSKSAPAEDSLEKVKGRTVYVCTPRQAPFRFQAHPTHGAIGRSGCCKVRLRRGRTAVLSSTPGQISSAGGRG